MFNPLSKSCPESSCIAYKNPESRRKQKRREIDIENDAFHPLVFVGTGGAGPSASNALKQLASVLSAQKEDSYGY